MADYFFYVSFENLLFIKIQNKYQIIKNRSVILNVINN